MWAGAATSIVSPTLRALTVFARLSLRTTLIFTAAPPFRVFAFELSNLRVHVFR
jgi:hypothetical protein